MAKQIDPEIIEDLVGMTRSKTAHYMRVGLHSRVYLLHSKECIEYYDNDLLKCPLTHAMDAMVDELDGPPEPLREGNPLEVRARNGGLCYRVYGVDGGWADLWNSEVSE